MTLVLLVVVIGVINICVGFTLGVHFQGMRFAASGTPGLEDDLPLDDDFSPYRTLAKSDEGSFADPPAAEQAEQ
jgi:hypothetical protein